jgi:hypothetical protein
LVPHQGGISSQNVGQQIQITASSGTYIGGGAGKIEINGGGPDPDSIRLTTNGGITLDCGEDVTLDPFGDIIIGSNIVSASGSPLVISSNVDIEVTAPATYWAGDLVTDGGAYKLGDISQGAVWSEVGAEQYVTPKQVFMIAGDLSSMTIDWDQGSSCSIDYTGFSGVSTISLINGRDGSSYVLETKNNAVGSATIFWSGANMLWKGGTSGVLTATSGALDVFSFYYNGNKYLSNAGNDYK